MNNYKPWTLAVSLYKSSFRCIDASIPHANSRKYLKNHLREQYKLNMKETDVKQIEKNLLRAHSFLISILPPEYLEEVMAEKD